MSAPEPLTPVPNALMLVADAIEETLMQALWGQTLAGGRTDSNGEQKVKALLEQVRRVAASEGQP